MELARGQAIYVKALFAWMLFSTSLVWCATRGNRVTAAVLDMGMGLVLIWCAFGGLAMWRYREPITRFVRAIRLDWRVKFVLFCTLLAMLEEVVTVSMTNLAPAFGVPIGRAYITASANYLDVVGLHSVIVFVSLFVGWAVILWRYDFRPFWVFILFGITGTLAEMGFGGPQHASEYGMWAFVYGLMVWLPARSVPSRNAREPRWWHYPLAVVVPFLFIPLFPLAGVVSLFFPNHPSMHFPPIQP